jgi:hypothetical protein
MSPVAASAAQQVLSQRALQCSFSSVFHLRRAGMNAKDAAFIERMFVVTVTGPLLLMGAAGVASQYWKHDANSSK